MPYFTSRYNMKFIKLILSLAKWLIMIGITLLAIYVISSNFKIFGGYQPYLVQSGSMEPAIMTGDIVVIQNQGSYAINDVVTFREADRLVTHRIISVEKEGGVKYSTKGDANRSSDKSVIGDEQIIGKVALVIPKLGYFVAFSKSTNGLIFLLILPAIIFVLDELVKVKKYA